MTSTREDDDLKFLLWSGPATIRYEGTDATLNCNVYQRSLAKEEMVIECEDISGDLRPFFTAGDLQLNIQGFTSHLTSSLSKTHGIPKAMAS